MYGVVDFIPAMTILQEVEPVACMGNFAAFETERSGGMGLQNPIQGISQRAGLFFIANRNRNVVTMSDKAFRWGNLRQRRSEQ